MSFQATHPPAAPPGFFPRFCWLYRLFGADGRLLYVGITRSGRDRIVKHLAKWWGPEVANVQWEYFRDRWDAEFAEAVAIASEGPRHNVMVNRATALRSGSSH